MKKIIIIFSLLVASIFAFGQRGVLNTVSVDTLQGAETVNFAIGTTILGSYNSLSISALCSELGGTSDGTLTLYGSNDGTNWVFVNGAADSHILTASPKASLTGTDMNQITITDALVANWVVDPAYRYYRVAGVGTTADTTQVNITYVYK
jgi:hypothetical protein